MVTAPAIQAEVAKYAGRGWQVTHQDGNSAALVRRKKFSLPAFLLSWLFFLFGGILYLLYYFLLKRDESLYLYLDESGQLQRRGEKWTVGRWFASRSRRTQLIVAGAVVLVIVLIAASAGG